MLIDDGKEDRTYFVGLGQRFEVVVVRISADGYPEAYAVLDSDHTLDPDNYGLDDEEHEFGSAFSYRMASSSAGTIVLASSS